MSSYVRNFFTKINLYFMSLIQHLRMHLLNQRLWHMRRLKLRAVVLIWRQNWSHLPPHWFFVDHDLVLSRLMPTFYCAMMYPPTPWNQLVFETLAYYTYYFTINFMNNLLIHTCIELENFDIEVAWQLKCNSIKNKSPLRTWLLHAGQLSVFEKQMWI